MMTFLIQSTIIWACLLIFYEFLLKNETFYRFNRIYLLLTLISGLTIPLIEIKQSSGIEYERVFADLSPIVISSGQEFNGIGFSDASASLMTWIWFALVIAYFIGLTYHFVKFLYGIRLISKMYAKGDKRKFNTHVEVYLDDILIPFSLHKWIFFPKSLLTSKSFESIRSHEIKHVEQEHSLDLILIELARIVFWFNPVLIFLKRALEENHEFVADQAGLKVMERKDYGKMLIDMNVSPLYLTFANNFKNSIIKNRLIMMYKTESKKQNHFKYMMVIPLMALFLLMFSCQQENVENKDEMKQAQKEVVKQEKENATTEIFKVVEQMPRFPGCDESEDKEAADKCSSQKLMQYIFSNLKYPEAARKNGIEGRVIASFVVDTDGMIRNITIKEDIGDGCGAEVVRVLESMNEMEKRWLPGMQKGEKVKVEYTLPVVFKLSDK